MVSPEFSCYLFSKFGIFPDKSFVGFEEFGNLFFQSCVFNLQIGNLLLIELFSFRCQFLPLRYLLWLLSGERGLLLENKYFFDLPVEVYYKMNCILKIGYLMLGVLPNAFKIPVNGYKAGKEH